MKKIEFETVPMMLNDKEIKLDYKKEIMELLLIPLDPQGGTQYEEMAIVLPIHAKIKEGKDYVLLENAEHEEVVKRLKNAKFMRNTPEIFKMINLVILAPEHLVLAQGL